MNCFGQINTLASKSYNGSHTYSDVVHFVHVYNVEAHPKSPDPSPYYGAVNERSWSDYNMPRTYSGRVALAQITEGLLTGGTQIMLVDDLTPMARNNPIWSSYGTCPTNGFLIDRTGKVVAAQAWLNVGQMETSIDNLVQ